jgi:hypothetical protein
MSAYLGVNHSLRKSDIRPQPRHISCEVPQQHESQRLAEIQDTANEASQKTKQQWKLHRNAAVMLALQRRRQGVMRGSRVDGHEVESRQRTDDSVAPQSRASSTEQSCKHL